MVLRVAVDAGEELAAGVFGTRESDPGCYGEGESEGADSFGFEVEHVGHDGAGETGQSRNRRSLRWGNLLILLIESTLG